MDPSSVAGKAPRVERRVPLVVIGAGPAGAAAALEAARAGVRVLLVDENPLDLDLMAMDVPLYFGQRMTPSVRNRSQMLERVVEANPGLTRADEAGVEVLLGACVWGAFRNGATQRELEGPLLGLADHERSWLVGYDRLVVAAGARDVAMGFSGWQKAGVMGASGLAALVGRYRAFAGRRLVILGSGPLGLHAASLALDAGVEVAAVVDVTAAPRGEPEAVRRLSDRGVCFLAGHTVKEASGRTGEVESITLIRLDRDLSPMRGTETEIACDAICLALGLTPNVELLDLLGCRLRFRSEVGGFVPETDAWLRTTAPGVFVAGDCAGVHEGLAASDATARDQGRLAGLAAAASLGAVEPSRVDALSRELRHVAPGGPGPSEAHGYWRTWLRSLVRVGGADVLACQCEEVTRRELLEVQPPRYLEWQSAAMGARGLGTLLRDGPLNQDQIKRLTRAGMGPCQGRRCREQVALLLSEEAGIPVSEIPLPSFRSPVRPLPLKVLWPEDEPAAAREHWVSWFGIPTQFTPHWTTHVDPSETTVFMGLGGESDRAGEPDGPSREPPRAGH
jgi:thioredoxin reductase